MDADKTPTDGKSTIELVLVRMGELSEDVRQALEESREANSIAVRNNEILRDLASRSIFRAAVPYVALAVAAFALVRAW